MAETIEPALEAALDQKGLKAAAEAMSCFASYDTPNTLAEDCIRAYLAAASPQAEIDRLREALAEIEVGWRSHAVGAIARRALHPEPPNGDRNG